MLQRRRLLFNIKSELPAGYKRVEYLESTGTQYIDTGIIQNKNIKFYIELQKLQNSGDTVRSGIVAVSGNPIRTNIGIRANDYYFGFGNQNIYVTDIPVDLEVHKMSIDIPNLIYTLDNIVYNKAEFIFGDNTYNRTLLLFCANDSSIPRIKGIMRIYKNEIFENGVQVRNFIPCLDNNNRPCMYDTISKQTFYNQGTNEFLYGNIIN